MLRMYINMTQPTHGVDKYDTCLYLFSTEEMRDKNVVNSIFNEMHSKTASSVPSFRCLHTVCSPLW